MIFKKLRSNTDIFLNKFQRSSTFDTDTGKFNIDIEGLELPEGLDTAGLQAAIATEKETGLDLTGAAWRSPVIPMFISLADKNNERITFAMLINPENMNHGKTNTANYEYTREGWKTQLWGPNQDTITATGKTAAFMVEGVGLTNFQKKRSFSFLNFMALFAAYRNNGYRIVDPTKANKLTRVIDTITGVELSYDNDIFMGHFSNFTLDEAAENSYLFNYNFEFVISSLNDEYTNVLGHFQPILTKKETKETKILKDTEKNIEYYPSPTILPFA